MMNKTKFAIILATIAMAGGLFKLMANNDTKTNVEHFKTFMKWKSFHNKNYSTPKEHLYRFGIFLKNTEVVKSHNLGNHGFTLALNKFADLTTEEFKAKYTGFKMIEERNDMIESKLFRETYPLGQEPASIDWNTKGAVTRVKNQGQCGSCWAFSTTGSLEGINQISGGTLTEYSEQQLVDCSTSYGNQGCNGGLMRQGFKYVQDKGITTEEDYPYKARDGKCKLNTSDPLFHISGFGTVPKNDNDALKKAVATQPVAVAVDATILQLYHGGVVGKLCGHHLDHGVLAAGYGNEHNKDYWLVKNSWGKTWGEHGYFKVLREAGVKAAPCGISMQASYATVGSQ